MPKKLEETSQMELSLNDLNETNRLRNEVFQLRAENERLQAEIEKLRRLVKVRGSFEQSSEKNTALQQSITEVTSLDSNAQCFKVTKHSPIFDKVALFRSYFRGRDDVYAVRGVDKSGKPAYFRAREYLGRENGKIVWGNDLPLTDKVITEHLQREDRPVTVGIYPLLLDETCWFLAIDFDKTSWREDTIAFLNTCRRMNVPAALERSRSGNGGHVWIFFEEPIPAKLARMLGCTLLTLTLENRYQIGLDSYDRMFPNQDTLPKDKKLGNLIALPLQRLPGKEGNSLFIDETFQPYKDQWVFLSSLRKMKRMEVEEIVHEAERKGNVLCIAKPLTEEEEENMNSLELPFSEKVQITVPFPYKMKLVLSNMVYIDKEWLSSSLIHHFTRMAAFQNPEFYKAQKMRLSTFGKPRIINCSEESPRYLALPRGCFGEVMHMLKERGVIVEVEDRRTSGTCIDVKFHGELTDEQTKAVQELIRYDFGILSATTAFGKTVVGAWMIAARAVNTLVLVHRTQLLEQWREKLALFLNIPIHEIGQIGGGKSKRTGHIDVAMLQSIYGREKMEACISEYGHIVVDECHHISAYSFEKVLKQAKAKYVLGLTATFVRKDGHHPIVKMQCGPVRYRVNAKSQAKNRPFRHVVIPRYTSFMLEDSEKNIPIQELYERLIADDLRNDQIFDDLLKALDQGRSPILLTDRISHLEYFENRLKNFAKNVIVLRGGMGKRRWKEIQDQIRSIPSDQERVFLATGRFAGEGFDDARLDTLFLVTPISWKGTLQQYAGRLHRLYDSKREVQIYDYVDIQVPLLMRMYKKRLKGYIAMGYSEQISM